MKPASAVSVGVGSSRLTRLTVHNRSIFRSCTAALTTRHSIQCTLLLIAARLSRVQGGDGRGDFQKHLCELDEPRPAHLQLPDVREAGGEIDSVIKRSPLT